MTGKGPEEAFIEHVRRVYQHSPDAVLCVAPDRRVVFANDAVCRLHGALEADIVGRPCRGPYRCVDAPCNGCLVDEVIGTGEPRSCHKHETRPSGEERFVEQSWFPITDHRGEVTFVVKAVRDVTALRLAERDLEERRQAETRLVEERNRAQSYLDVAAAIMLGLDRDGRVTLINDRGCEILGLSESEIIGRSWFETFVPDDDRDSTLAYYRATIADGEPTPAVHENAVERADGETRAIEWHNTLLRDEAGAVSGVLSSGIDITDRRTAEEESRFKSLVLDKAIDAIVVHTPEGRILYANEQAHALGGCSREEFLRLPPFAWVAPAFREVTARKSQLVQDEGVAVYESAALRADGSEVPLEVHAMTMDLNGERAVVSAGRDVTERKQAQDTIARMAFYDALTGLANRALFFDRLQHAMDSARRTESTVAVAFLDLDHFKAVNDTLGHRHGDALLVDVANRLVASVRSCDTVARLGGDEFTVLFERVTDEVEAMELADRLLACFSEPFDLGDQELFITTSVGVAIADPKEAGAEELVLRADTAMYHAKEQGRNGAQVFRHHMGESARDRFALKNDLRFALEHGEMSLHYQPQFRVTDHVLTGVEALLRWDHPTRGPVGPASFLPLAEESGQIVGLGAWVLREACTRMQAWTAAGLGDDLRVAVNLSTRQFEDPDLLAVVTELLAESGLSPGRLELEVTESLATHDIRHMRSTFDGLRALGVRLAIDDFGTGFSSLDRVMQLNVDTLKLDRRFVSELGRGGRARAICGAIIFLAHALGLNVIAEGVETDEQLLFLVENECDEMQGFLLGRPVPVPQIEELLRDRLR